MFWLLPRPDLTTILAIVGVGAVAIAFGFDPISMVTGFLSGFVPDWMDWLSL